MPRFKRSTKLNKKYMVITPKGRTIHFGDKRYQHYHDKIGLYKHLDHNDSKRRALYRQRHKKDKINDPEYPGYYSWRYLW